MNNGRKNSVQSMYSFQLRLRHRHPKSGRGIFPEDVGFSVVACMVMCSLLWESLVLRVFPSKSDLPTPSWGTLCILSQTSYSVSNTFSLYVALPLDWQLPHGRSLFISFATVSISNFLPSSGNTVSAQQVLVNWIKEQLSGQCIRIPALL